MWSLDNTIPEMQAKVAAVREKFAVVANTALSKGRTESEAIFAGIVAAQQYEKQLTKKALLTPLAPAAKEEPYHMRVIRKAAEMKKQQVLQKQEVETVAPVENDISELMFDEEGKLVVKFKNGKVMKTKNAMPKPELVNQYVTIQNTAVTTDTGTGQSFLSEFSDENELDRNMVYSEDVLTRINYQSGNYKTFEYSGDGSLYRVNYYKSDGKNYRKTFYYTLDGKISSIDYEIITPTPGVFSAWFVPQYSEPQTPVTPLFTSYFGTQYS